MMLVSTRFSTFFGFRPTLIGLALLFSVTAMASEVIYTWTDDQGVRHFSSQPPEGRQYRIVEMFGQAPAPTDSASGQLPVLPPPALAEVSQAMPDPEVLRERCTQARLNLDLLRQDRPAMLRGEDGEPVPLDDTARQQLIQETQDFITDWC